MTRTGLRDAPSLPVADQVATTHRKPRPKRPVVGEAHLPAMHDQPDEDFLCGVKCHVFARALLLEVAHETQGVTVVDQPHGLRLTPEGLEQIPVRRASAAHHLQTNMPRGLGQPNPSIAHSSGPVFGNDPPERRVRAGAIQANVWPRQGRLTGRL